MTAAQHEPAFNEAVGRLAREDVPILFDAVKVRQDGSVVHEARNSLRFAFDYLGATFNAEGLRTGDRFTVAVSADLGPLPFSAESSLARRAILELVAASKSATGPSLTIDPDQIIRIRSRFELLQPVSPMVVVTMVTELLLVLKPWLVRLGDLLAVPTLRAPGNA